MKYILGVCTLLLLSACSMAPSKNDNTIRIIKVEPKKYVHEQQYKSKIEEVAFTSSISAPSRAITTNRAETPKDNISQNKYTREVSSRVSSEGNRVTSDVESKVDNLIEGSIDSLFR